VTERYAGVRASLLINAVRGVPGLAQRLEEATKTLEQMTGLYAQVARAAATHRRRPSGVSVP
jgi:predicted MarR family transcription regulator